MMLTRTVMEKIVLLLIWGIVEGCGSPTSPASEEITSQFQSSGRTFVNLAKALPEKWEKVCIFGPYSDNKAAKDTLGFSWDLEKQSSITTNEGIGLLVLIKGKKVVNFVEHSRRDGDFTNLSRKCFSREQSTFYYQNNPKKGWPGLFPNKT